MCGDPFIETTGGSSGMVFIPSVNFDDPAALPSAQRHIYYRLREADAPDDLPKNDYFADSQAAIGGMVVRVIAGRH